MNLSGLSRRAVGIAFAVVTLLSCAIGLFVPWKNTGPDYGGLLLNIGSELLGIVLTVLTLDAWNERRQHEIEQTIDSQNQLRQREAEINRIAWELLHEIDDAVWTWLGGHRRFDLAELLGLLRDATEGDPLPFFVRNKIKDISSRAAQYLELRRDLITPGHSFEQACTFLQPIAGIQDTPWCPPSQTDLANVLGRAIRSLCSAVGVQPPQPNPDTEWQKDTRFQSQQWRFSGRVFIDRDFDISQD